MLYETDASSTVNETVEFTTALRPRESDRASGHILIPTALKPRDRAAILMGLQMASAGNSKVTLLHVILKEASAFPADDPSISVHWLEAIESLHRALSRKRTVDSLKALQGARDRLAAFLDEEIPTPLWRRVDWRLECGRGDVAEEIVRFAAAESVDLLILSSELSQWRLPIVPSRVHRVLQQARCRVMVVKPEPAHGASPRKPSRAAR
jgi:nucleotide-binding universal stress UspA family protein